MFQTDIHHHQRQHFNITKTAAIEPYNDITLKETHLISIWPHEGFASNKHIIPTDRLERVCFSSTTNPKRNLTTFGTQSKAHIAIVLMWDSASDHHI